MCYSQSAKHLSTYRCFNKYWWGLWVIFFSRSECRSECDSCFNRNFCTRCRAGFYLHLGKCLDSCPVGMVRSDAQRECVPSECLRFTFHKADHKVVAQTWCVQKHAELRCVPVSTGCSAECESCVNSDTCTRCRPGLYHLNGKCYHICPDDYEPNDKLMECTPQGKSYVRGLLHLLLLGTLIGNKLKI